MAAPREVNSTETYIEIVGAKRMWSRDDRKYVNKVGVVWSGYATYVPAIGSTYKPREGEPGQKVIGHRIGPGREENTGNTAPWYKVMILVVLESASMEDVEEWNSLSGRDRP